MVHNRFPLTGNHVWACYYAAVAQLVVNLIAT
jgi:hypothetical protein